MRWFPYRLRWLGAGWIGVIFFVAVAMVNSGTNLLYFIFGLLVGAFLLSFLFSALALRKVTVERILVDHGVAGEPAGVRYVVTNRKRYWPAMAMRVEEADVADKSGDLARTAPGFVLYLPARASVELNGGLVAPRRGLVRLSEIRLTTSFPFGFLTKISRRPAPGELLVYPRIGMLNRRLALQYRESIETGTMTSNVRGGADEFYGLREYRPGDSVRSIHWRTTARTQLLMIREMAANAPPQMIVVLNIRGWKPAERDAVERAIELTASLLCYGFFENFAVGLAIAGLDLDEPPSPRMGREVRDVMLRRLATLDLAAVRQDACIVFPNKLAGRAEWIVVTLHGGDAVGDLTSPRGNEGRDMARGGHHMVLAMDDADAGNWVHFFSAAETMRLLRDHTMAAPVAGGAP